MGSVRVEDAQSRYISSFTSEFISEVMCFCAEKYQMSPDEVAILSLVASENVREMRNNAYLTRHFGGEKNALPVSERLPVNVKFVHTRLGMSRETIRRKMKIMAEKRLIEKTKGGFVVPAQMGPDDYSYELRVFVVKKLILLENYIKSMPDDSLSA